jgi:hypothetical protein
MNNTGGPVEFRVDRSGFTRRVTSSKAPVPSATFDIGQPSKKQNTIMPQQSSMSTPGSDAPQARQPLTLWPETRRDIERHDGDKRLPAARWQQAKPPRQTAVVHSRVTAGRPSGFPVTVAALPMFDTMATTMKSRLPG